MLFFSHNSSSKNRKLWQNSNSKSLQIQIIFSFSSFEHAFFYSRKYFSKITLLQCIASTVSFGFWKIGPHFRNHILLRKLFWHCTVRKSCSCDRELFLKIEGRSFRICNFFWDQKNNLLERWKVRPICETQYFFNLLLSVTL